MTHSMTMRIPLFAVIALFVFADDANSLNLRTSVLNVYQVNASARVRLGHTVIASTIYNRLYAGGTYTAGCAHPQMGAATGGRGFSGENLTGGVQLYVTIPETLPALVNMPGYWTLPRGTEVNCTYYWTSTATEGGYTVGVAGINFQTGNGTRNEANTQEFYMRVPGSTDPNENSSCIP
jgi:hypothetical protein